MSCFARLALPVFAVAAAAAAPLTDLSKLNFEPAPGGVFIARSAQYQVTLVRDGAQLAGPGMAIGIRFARSTPGDLEPLDRQPAVVNYLIGANPVRWRRDVPTFARIRRRGVYPGIDALFYGSDDRLEYDLLVAPGADVSRIVLEFAGARNLHLADDAQIAIDTAGGTLLQRRPTVYQDTAKGRVQLDAHYRLLDASHVALVIPKYDGRLPLTIDPVLVYATQIGGNTGNQVNGMTVDSQGNTYLTGTTSAVNFPVVNGLQSQLAAGTFYRLDNGGASITRLDTNPAAIQTLTADASNPGTVYAGTVSGIFKSTDAGAHWLSANAGLPTGVPFEPIAIDPTDSQVLYTSANGIYQSLDGGTTWNAIGNGLPASITQPTFYSGSSYFYIDPFHPSRIFLNTPSGPFLSTDRGASWNAYPDVFNILAFDLSTDGTIYRYYQSVFFKSTDGGNTWSYLSFLAGNSASLVIDPFQPSNLYATSTAGVYLSTDSGRTWQLSSPANLSLNSLFADPATRGTLYGAAGSQGLFKTTDSGAIWTRITSNGLFVTGAALGPNSSGTSTASSIYAATQPSTNAFVTKLDPKGNIVYSSYIGGSLSDRGTAITLDSQGNIFVTGITTSPDFPTTPGAFGVPTNQVSGFVLKLDPAGNSLIYSAAVAGAQPGAIAVDAQGAAYVTGSSTGGLPVTAGAYWTQPPMFISTGFFGIPQADSFAFKMNPSGSALAYATYLKQTFLPGGSGACDFANDQTGRGITVDGGGNAYLANAASALLDKLSADGSSMLSVIQLPAKARAVALDGSGNVYITGNNALVEKLDPTGAPIFSTQLGGSSDNGRAIALDSQGNIVIAGNTCSSVFPTRAPLQGSFGPETAFLSKLDPSANLLFSTYVGSVSAFQISGMGLDPNGQAILAGSVYPAPGNSIGAKAFVAKYDMSNLPSLRLDDVHNAASQLGIAVSPGEIINVDGAGFSASGNTQLLFDGAPATVLSTTAAQIVAIVPYALAGKTQTQIQVQSGGQMSNPVWCPVAPTSPGIYTADGSGSGLALAFNQDGSQNSPSNPAPTGSTVTFFATGVGQTTPPGVDGVLHHTGAAFPIYPVYTFLNSLFVPKGSTSVGPYPGFPADVAVMQIQIPIIYASPIAPLLNITANGQKSQEENYPSSNSPTVYIAIKP